MWQMALTFLVVIIIRFAIRAYNQNALLKELTKLEQETRLKINKKRFENFETDECEGQNVDTKTNKKQIREEEEEDYDEYSTGHNVTKILTASKSRSLHLTPEQIERGQRVNKELMETLSKRKLHTE